jgi:FKBP-type peptidyl-prolyl cis-trans isomerase SlyD
MITTNKSVKLNYQLKEDNAEGRMIESTYESSPLEFVFGAGKMIPMFEEQLEGKAEGDKFAFSIPADQAYGQVNPSAVMNLDLDIFRHEGEVDYNVIKVGNMVPMRDSQGRRMDGLVKEVTETQVSMDFNHPLAGINLYFEGEILSVSDAPVEVHEHHHGEGGCGCGSGCGCH